MIITFERWFNMRIAIYLLKEEFMKSIRRLSLVLIIFSLFSISYLATSVSAGITGNGSGGLKCDPGSKNNDPGGPECQSPAANVKPAPATIEDTLTGADHMNQGDPCMEAPAGPDRAACYAAQGNHFNAAGNHPQIDPCMDAPAGRDRAACYASKSKQLKSSKGEEEYNNELKETEKKQDEAKKKALEKWKIEQHAKCMNDNGRRKFEGKVELPCCGEKGQVSC
jgi:hypothetical protein